MAVVKYEGKRLESYADYYQEYTNWLEDRIEEEKMEILKTDSSNVQFGNTMTKENPIETGYAALMLAIFGKVVRDENGRIVDGQRRFMKDSVDTVRYLKGEIDFTDTNSEIMTPDADGAFTVSKKAREQAEDGRKLIEKLEFEEKENYLKMLSNAMQIKVAFA